MSEITGGVRVRTAVWPDLHDLRRIYRAAALSNSGDVDALLTRPEFLEYEGTAVGAGTTRVAQRQHAGVLLIVGFATVSLGEHGEPELDDLFVDPPWQRHGVALRLVEDAADRLRGSGHTRLWVTGNPHASAFYRAAGFVGTGRVETELGPGLRLHRVIPAR
ncbi:GNAT family N-acetyltransferase [Phycicoccus sp. KQZ13P-1]|uniref:GNAT family N-acetyltransferase n=1 Tax=Phycicoccus mangrovi TaxID=2840470 RepID=UPI001C002FF8|nr:GNAT family N-acetyltransferase [Phycicoccus mangrovi]MBT9255285.1 GNAT family N-acetyltransferase [Phycicoccus mangrovi]